MSPDSVETRVGVLGERIAQIAATTNERLTSHDHQLRALGSIVAEFEVLKDRFNSSQTTSAEYRATTLAQITALSMKLDHHIERMDKELEERDEKARQEQRDNSSRTRTTWFAVIGAVTACGALIVAIIGLAGHLA